MKIGFLGGTFSPPHLGHLHSAKVFIEEMGLDKLIIIPAKVSPFKVDSKATASDKDRYNMACLCFGALNGVEISKIELDKNETSYTIETIRVLKETYPDDELFMFVGSDMFLSLEKWREFEDIFKSCVIYTRCREKNEMPTMQKSAQMYREKYGARVHLSDDGEIVISSTDVRTALEQKNTDKCRNLLTDGVFGYIMERGLYF